MEIETLALAISCFSLGVSVAAFVATIVIDKHTRRMLALGR